MSLFALNLKSDLLPCLLTFRLVLFYYHTSRGPVHSHQDGMATLSPTIGAFVRVTRFGHATPMLLKRSAYRIHNYQKGYRDIAN